MICVSWTINLHTHLQRTAQIYTWNLNDAA